MKKEEPLIHSPFLDWPPDEVLVLASASPRRAELLKVAGIPFTVRFAPDVEAAHDRSDRDRDPEAYAVTLALAKAGAVAADLPGRLVLGADTVVVRDGEVLEKPRDEAEAVRMLASLQGRAHTVITAVALRHGADGVWSAAERTDVEFLPLDEAAIAEMVEEVIWF